MDVVWRPQDESLWRAPSVQVEQDCAPFGLEQTSSDQRVRRSELQYAAALCHPLCALPCGYKNQDRAHEQIQADGSDAPFRPPPSEARQEYVRYWFPLFHKGEATRYSGSIPPFSNRS